MNILVLADIHGNAALVERVVEETTNDHIDVVVVPGEVTNMFSVPPELSQTDVALLVLQRLFLFRRPVLCLPGNHDPQELVYLFDGLGVNLQESVVKVGEATFVGWGGAPTPFGTACEPTEDETRAFFSFMEKKIPTPFVLVTHNPPHNTILDALPSGEHVGSPAIRAFIEKTHPVLALSAHIENSPGTGQLGTTTLFYPGPLTAGFYGIVALGGGKATTSRRRLSGFEGTHPTSNQPFSQPNGRDVHAPRSPSPVKPAHHTSA